MLASCGLIEGLERHDWSDVAVFSVETGGAAWFAASIKTGGVNYTRCELIRMNIKGRKYEKISRSF